MGATKQLSEIRFSSKSCIMKIFSWPGTKYIYIYTFSMKQSKGSRLLRNQSEKDNFSVSIEHSKAHQKYENSILFN